MTLYFDTSVLVPLYVPQTGSDACQRLLDSAAQPTVSSLTLVEFASAASRLVRMRMISPEDGDRVVRLFKHHVATAQFRIVAVGSAAYTLAEGWLSAFDTPLRTLDALHLATAHEHDLPLITRDQALLAAARDLQVRAQSPA